MRKINSINNFNKNNKFKAEFKAEFRAVFRMVLWSLLFLFLFGLLINFLKFFGFGLSYQESQSMTPGWYVAYPIFGFSKIKRNEKLLFQPNKITEDLMLERGWIAPHAFLMKYAMGVPGDFICIKKNYFWINGQKIGKIFQKDSLGRPLPKLKFCRVLEPKEYWMGSTRVMNSFDSRYFGVVNVNQIKSQVVKI